MIGYLVAAAARYTPWQSRCLVQVLVTQRLLAKRNIPGQFYLGVRRGCELHRRPHRPVRPCLAAMRGRDRERRGGS